MERISREQFEPARALLDAARRKTRPRVHDLYDVFSAVLYYLDSGTPWRSMPREFPPWRTVHEYFMQWSAPRANGTSLLEEALPLAGRSDLLPKLQARVGGEH